MSGTKEPKYYYEPNAIIEISFINWPNKSIAQVLRKCLNELKNLIKTYDEIIISEEMSNDYFDKNNANDDESVFSAEKSIDIESKKKEIFEKFLKFHIFSKTQVLRKENDDCSKLIPFMSSKLINFNSDTFYEYFTYFCGYFINNLQRNENSLERIKNALDFDEYPEASQKLYDQFLMIMKICKLKINITHIFPNVENKQQTNLLITILKLISDFDHNISNENIIKLYSNNEMKLNEFKLFLSLIVNYHKNNKHTRELYSLRMIKSSLMI